MKQVTCPDCGANYAANVLSCPTCGCPNDNYSAKNNVENSKEPASNEKEENVPPQYSQPQQVNVAVATEKTDWANYIYECGLLMWHSFTRKFATFDGRATRREYWSFQIIALLFCFSGILFLVVLIPYLAVAARRMHDINKSGWWILVPIASFFLYLKKSDDGANDYGEPSVDDI